MTMEVILQHGPTMKRNATDGIVCVQGLHITIHNGLCMKFEDSSICSK